MKKYLLPPKNCYKANLHCHSTISDGKITVEELKELYKRNGYSILAYTDHEVLVTHSDLTSAEFPISDLDLFVRFTVVDAEGKTANTRGYWRDEFEASRAIVDFTPRKIRGEY